MVEIQKLVCIFAHPDDEAFGPSGTILNYARKIPVELICVTSGDYPRDEEKGRMREAELINSSQILGIKKVHFLRFHDGELCNNNYHSISDKIKEILDEVKPDTIMTFDQNGVSGHLDHIAVSMISTYLYERLKYIKQIMYFCNASGVKKLMGKKYFVYFPPGVDEESTDLVVDVSKVWKTKLNAMKAHISQVKDYTMLIALFKRYLKKEYFKVLVK